ncbi:MAG: hypothetical protein ABSD62_10380 [Candidatus Limnocylindrales bacterium]|jgi:hypothetical protein
MSSDDMLGWGIFLVSFGIPVIVVIWFLLRFRGTTGSIKNGIPTDALIQSIAETGMTITSPGAGPEAPVYKLGLLVTPPGGGTPYAVEDTHAIPRIFVPMVMPGARIGVLVDPKNPAKVVPDWQRLNAPGTAAATPYAGSSYASEAAAILGGPEP